MAKGSRRYPFVIYTILVDRWRSAILWLGIAITILAWPLYSQGVEQWRWLSVAGLGGLNIFIAIVLWIIRKGAYIQPFGDHVRLVTPFLRLNVSYKRFLRVTSANMGALFPPKSVSNWQAEIIEPHLKQTVLVIELNGYPMSRSSLRLFLSPFFFKPKDNTSHFVILVDDWMRLSSEMESMRSSGTGGTGSSTPSMAPQQKQTQQKRDNSILSRLPTKDK